MISSLLLLPLLEQIAECSPLNKRQGAVGPWPCNVNYSNNNENQIDGSPTTAGVFCAAGSTGCTIGESESYSVSTTITEGAQFGIDLGEVSIGFSSSIAYTTGTATTDTGTAQCPPGAWSCGLEVTPSFLQVNGAKSYDDNAACYIPNGQGEGNYQVQFPLTSGDGNAIIKVQACTCPEQPGAYDSGAPPLCPNSCDGGPIPPPPSSSTPPTVASSAPAPAPTGNSGNSQGGSSQGGSSQGGSSQGGSSQGGSSQGGSSQGGSSQGGSSQGGSSQGGSSQGGSSQGGSSQGGSSQGGSSQGGSS